jgi:hypothetical protein
MVDLALLQSVSYIAGALGVCLAAAYYIMNLKVQQTNLKQTLETRQMQLYMQSLQETRTKPFLKDWIEICYNQTYNDYQEWRSKYGPSVNPESYSSWVHVTQLYQGLGYLVESKMIEPETLAKYIAPRSFIFLWEKMQPIVKYQREHLDPSMYDSYEYLVKEMNKLLTIRFEKMKLSQR